MKKQQKKLKIMVIEPCNIYNYHIIENTTYISQCLRTYVQTMHLFVRMVTSRFTCLIQTNTGMEIFKNKSLICEGNLHMHDLHTNLCVQVFYNCFWYENYNLQR